MESKAVILCVFTIFLALIPSQRLANVDVSKQFPDHIERIEGFRAQAYRDTGGVLTIGFGHVVKPSEAWLQTVTLTREQATDILRKDTKSAAEAVNGNVKVLLRQEQFDALVSFVFNVGETQFRQSTLLRKLNAGHCCAVPDELRRWTKDNGRVYQGLIRRRDAEIALYRGDG